MSEDLQSQQELYRTLDEIIARYDSDPGLLIRMLQKTQETFGYISEDVQCYLAEKLNIPLSEICGVVSFYSLFTTRPKGKHMISVCLGTACYVKGAQEILEAFKRELQVNVNQTSEDGLFMLRTTRCVGACGLAPVVTIDDDVHGQLAVDALPKVLQKYRKPH